MESVLAIIDRTEEEHLYIDDSQERRTCVSKWFLYIFQGAKKLISFLISGFDS